MVESDPLALLCSVCIVVFGYRNVLLVAAGADMETALVWLCSVIYHQHHP